MFRRNWKKGEGLRIFLVIFFSVGNLWHKISGLKSETVSVEFLNSVMNFTVVFNCTTLENFHTHPYRKPLEIARGDLLSKAKN